MEVRLQMKKQEEYQEDFLEEYLDSTEQNYQEEEPLKKKKKKKKRKKKRYFLKFLIFVVLCVGVGFFLSSSFFDIQNMKVVNNEYYTSEQIIAKSKVKVATNIFAMKTKDVRDRLVADPYIKSVKVKRKLPETVIFDVVERKEFAAVPFGEEYIILDEEGLVLRMSNVEPALTQLLGMTLTAVDPGKPLDVEENAVLTETLMLLKEVDANELFFKKIDISNVIIKAYIYDNLTCEGTPENIKKNMASLQSVLQQQYEEGIKRGVLKVGSEGVVHFSPVIE